MTERSKVLGPPKAKIQSPLDSCFPLWTSQGIAQGSECAHRMETSAGGTFWLDVERNQYKDLKKVNSEQETDEEMPEMEQYSLQVTTITLPTP